MDTLLDDHADFEKRRADAAERALFAKARELKILKARCRDLEADNERLSHRSVPPSYASDDKLVEDALTRAADSESAVRIAERKIKELSAKPSGMDELEGRLLDAREEIRLLKVAPSTGAETLLESEITSIKAEVATLKDENAALRDSIEEHRAELKLALEDYRAVVAVNQRLAARVRECK